MKSPSLVLTFLILFNASFHAEAQLAPRINKQEIKIDDSRDAPLKDLNGFFPLKVPNKREVWELRREEVKRRILLACGLWPMPHKTKLNPVIHGKSVRDGFTVEKVYFESYPGLYVTGLLFKPANIKEGQKLPAVLCPHGHGGRLHDHGEEGVKKQIVKGAERFVVGGRMPKIARSVALARQGYIVFLFDMFGYADSQQISRDIAHRFSKQRPDFDNPESWGFFSTQAELRLQSIFGLQTWNAIRALDFLETLPETDPKKLCVTGNSGGGTQTIILCAIDDRPVVAFANGMISSSMQGGCTCENASLLRIGTGNVEFAAIFAPKPMGMTAANDWTKEMLVPGKGFPELKKIYELYGMSEFTMCPDLTYFDHNYNYPTRALMYSWFNKHLKLGLEEPILEEDYKLLTDEEQSVWGEKHPAPPGGIEFERGLTRWLAKNDQALLDELDEKERKSILLAAWKTMIGRELPSGNDLLLKDHKLRQKSVGEEISIKILRHVTKPKKVIIWLHPDGILGVTSKESQKRKFYQKLLDTESVVITANLYQQGQFLRDGNILKKTRTVANKRESAAYTHGYNHSLFAQRVHDIHKLFVWAHHEYGEASITLLGEGEMGPLVAAATLDAPKYISSVMVTQTDFSFAQLTSYRDPMFIPGALKYGDYKGLLGLLKIPRIYTSGLSESTVDWIFADDKANEKFKQE